VNILPALLWQEQVTLQRDNNDWWACTKDGRKLGVEKGTAQKLNSLKNIYHFLFVILVV
jgi:hypothetical protein